MDNMPTPIHEEARRRYSTNGSMSGLSEIGRKRSAFIAGANWQKEQDADLLKCLSSLYAIMPYDCAIAYQSTMDEAKAAISKALGQ